MSRRSIFAVPKDDEPEGAALVSSARYSISPHQRPDVASHTTKTWHDRAWYLYDHLAEVSQASRLTANTASLAQILPGKTSGPHTIPLDNENPNQPLEGDDAIAFEVANDVYEGIFGQTSASVTLRLTVENLFVTGEVWLIQPFVPGTDQLRTDSAFIVVPANKIFNHGDERQPRIGYTDHLGKEHYFRPDQTVLRFHYAHPAKIDQPTSSVAAILDEGESLLLLRQLLNATASSNIHAGMLGIPEELILEGKREEFQTAMVSALTEAIEHPESASAVAPHLLIGKSEFLQYLKHVALSRPFDEELPVLMQRLEARIVRGLDLPSEIIEGGAGAANHWCRPQEVMALTRGGWVSHDQLSIGTEILTYNEHTRESEWQPVLDLYRADVIDEELLRFSRKGFLQTMTAEHRCIVEDKDRVQSWKLAKDLEPNDFVLRRAPHDLPQEPVVSDELVELMGWYWTEGSGPTIAQSHSVNPEKVDRIAKALEKLCGPETPSNTPLTKNVPGWKRVYQNTEYGQPITVFRMSKPVHSQLHKHVPLSFIDKLTADQLELFIEVSILGDGRQRVSEVDTVNIWQRDGSMLDAIEYAAILAGHTVTRYVEGNGVNLTISRGKTAKRIRVGTPELIKYTGTVWCPTTANGTWYSQEDGKVSVTGNSSWSINANYVRNHIQPIISVILETITRRVLWPKLQEAGIVDYHQYGYTVDLTDLAGQPNMTKNAIDAYRLGVLSHEALLRYLGFAPGDMADPVRTSLGATGFSPDGSRTSTERANGTNPDRPDEIADSMPSQGEDNSDA